jgi:D-alanyl-D-alanine carboxypeptidase
MKSFIIAFGILSSSASLTYAGEIITAETQAIDLARLDGFALGLEKADQFSGVVLVAKDGYILLEKAYGKKDAKAEALATPNTRFNLASAGKMFTSAAILQQIALGRITLDTTVGEVIKDYPNELFATSVTVRHLLTHTSGAGDIDLFGVENAKNRARVNSVSDMVELHSSRPPGFSPGTKQEYGNFAFVILGRMVELLAGEKFENYVQRHIFTPAGMTETSFANCKDRSSDIASGYSIVNKESQSNCMTLPARGFPAGGQVSTASDMLRFVQALQNERLIPAALFQESIKTQREYMGLGFFATGYGPNINARDFRWGHGGSADGICTDIRTYPKTNETIIVLANRDAPICYAVSNFLHDNFNASSEVKR